MYCQKCGAKSPRATNFCMMCGSKIMQTNPAAQPAGSLRGYSTRISDPAFKKYIKNSNRWAAIFSLILAVIAVVGFTIAGEVGNEMDNPQSMFIGFAVGGMFLLIALIQIAAKHKSVTWDGMVEDKTIKKKTQRQNYGNDVHYEDYLEYTVIIRSEHGKRYMIRHRNNDQIYNYYRIGDKVRYHAGLMSYEKYDKSQDKFIPCNACGTLCDIQADSCFRCKCPLLK